MNNVAQEFSDVEQYWGGGKGEERGTLRPTISSNKERSNDQKNDSSKDKKLDFDIVLFIF